MTVPTPSPPPATPDLPAEWRVVVTGASGGVGGAVAKALAKGRNGEGGSRVVAPCRNREKARARLGLLAGAVEIVHWDMSSPLAYSGRVDAVVHAAGKGDPASYASDPAGCARDNVAGCLNILEFARARRVKRFVFISSGEIYGAVPGDGPIVETDKSVVDPLDPRSCYPLGKLACEGLCRAYGGQYGLPIAIARLCHTYGPGFDRDDSRIAVQFPLAAAQGRDIVMKSAGEQRRSLCHVDDAARAILAVLARGAAGEAYNVADDGAGITVREFAGKVAAIGGVGVVFAGSAGDERSRFNPMPHAVLSGEKLRSLGWNPVIGLDEGIGETILSFKNAFGRG